MSKNDALYFENFISCADCACRAAKILEDVLEYFDSDTIEPQVRAIHKVEHEGDLKKRQMMESLSRAFLTPIEPEDIIALSQSIDEITDTIEDVLLRIYMCNIKKIRPDAIQFARLTVTCCETLKQSMINFPYFKKATVSLKQLIIRVNDLEEEGDRIFLHSMRSLHTSCTNPAMLIAWRDVFHYQEKCLDACKHTAAIIEAVIMKNS